MKDIVVNSTLALCAIAAVWGINWIFDVVIHAVQNRIKPLPKPPDTKPRSATTELTALIAVALLPIFVDFVEVSYALSLLRNLISLLAILFACGMNRVPMHSRFAKYLVFIVGYQGMTFRWVTGVNPIFSLVLVVGLTVPALIYLKAGTPLQLGSLHSQRTVIWHREITWFQGTDILSVLGMLDLHVFGFGLCYLIVRYAVKRKLSSCPVLYLRPFQQDNTPRVFAEVVHPGVSRYAPLTGLVNARQDARTLQAASGALWLANFHVVSDEIWKDWVTLALDRAVGVVVDASVSTEAVIWELKTALERLGPERVFLLIDENDNPDAVLKTLSISPKWCSLYAGAGRSTCARAISAWMHELTLPYAPDQGSPVICSMRYQVPPWVYFSVLIALVAVLALPAP